MNSVNDIWEEIIKILSKQLTPTAISTWFSDCTPVEIDDCKLVLHTTTDFKRSIITSRFGDTIKSALSDLFSCDFDILVLAGDEIKDFSIKKKAENSLPEMEGYTFDRFIVGNSNRFAHAAAVAVAEKPGIIYNPLFIYGNSGLGKTHLLLAIGQEIHEKDPSKKIAYLKGDEFTIQLVRSIKDGTAEEFRTKYRNVDLFLVDDIQFIAGKEQTQEEFFNTFNNLYEAGKQIVLTSDRPPSDMLRLEDRLRTRFEWGLMADIQPPDYETRCAIIKNKSILLGLNLPSDIIEYIAQNITANVRQLEGTIKRLMAYRDLMDSEINDENASRAIRELIRNKDEFVPSPEVIVEETAKFYDLDPKTIMGESRKANIVLARQVSMYIIRSITNQSLPEVGKFFGQHHTTVMHSVEKIEKMLSTDRELKEVIRDIKANVNDRF